MRAAAEAQASLFDLLDDAPATALMRAVDDLNRRYGRDTVTYAAAGTYRSWGLRNAFLSPRYTTCWEELLTVTDRKDVAHNAQQLWPPMSISRHRHPGMVAQKK